MTNLSPEAIEQGVLNATSTTVDVMVGVFTGGLALPSEIGRYSLKSATFEVASAPEEEEEEPEASFSPYFPENTSWTIATVPESLGSIALGENGQVFSTN